MSLIRAKLVTGKVCPVGVSGSLIENSLTVFGVSTQREKFSPLVVEVKVGAFGFGSSTWFEKMRLMVDEAMS